MKNIEIIGKITGVALSVLYMLLFQDNEIFEWILFGTIILTIGIPHGALDYLILNPRISNKELITFIFKYLAIIFAYMIVWVFFPILALVAFLLMSAFHFGQSHFIGKKITIWKNLTYLSIGTYYISVILWGGFEQTSIILHNLMQLESYAVLAWPIILCSFSLSLILIVKNLPLRWHIYVIEMLALGILLYQLPLLTSFVIYFGFWHALPSMKEEYQSLKIYLGKNHFKNFVIKMIPFSAVSLVGMMIILAVFYPESKPEELTLLFFILVSLISAPHIWYMNSFLETKKS
ncbi:Brp/Blh family beta-carotene 15,15'-dioxygenase [Cecembia rubra]|uniref:Probable beta-carotene 15,15'-dioxygenase n=1 Tax=Cecembia rubra TaxID=1485585 RepID=A0A2P8ECA3_9BACT|nr:Brp/Blh family beta-carotene 15,15'-dioxygenase [Cecembia rubra]PSL07081.1 Brp/Blh family beta-carotene 15,15'-monooxygenase [Cecembia rubra]